MSTRSNGSTPAAGQPTRTTSVAGCCPSGYDSPMWSRRRGESQRTSGPYQSCLEEQPRSPGAFPAATTERPLWFSTIQSTSGLAPDDCVQFSTASGLVRLLHSAFLGSLLPRTRMPNVTSEGHRLFSFLEKVENYAISHPRRVPPRNSVRSRNARIANVADNRSRWIRSNRSEGRPAIAVSGLLTGR